MNSITKKIKNKRGFTLVELLVVIAIMGILSAVSVTGYVRYLDKSKQSANDQQLNEIVKAFDIAMMQNEEYNETTIYSYDDIKKVSDLKQLYEYLSDSKLPTDAKLTMDDSYIIYENNKKISKYQYKTTTV